MLKAHRGFEVRSQDPLTGLHLKMIAINTVISHASDTTAYAIKILRKVW